MQVAIDRMTPDDWEAVRRLYRQGIATGDATFETEVPEWEQWDRTHQANCRLVARHNHDVVGWTALLPISTRPAYAGVAEVSTYVEVSMRGKSIGKSLLSALVLSAEEEGMWSLQSAMFVENKASVALHKVCGFRKIGIRKKLGRLGSTWRNVLLMERRSSKVGK